MVKNPFSRKPSEAEKNRRFRNAKLELVNELVVELAQEDISEHTMAFLDLDRQKEFSAERCVAALIEKAPQMGLKRHDVVSTIMQVGWSI